jgi:site-specific DNA-methyltransferase (adenine-specific)
MGGVVRTIQEADGTGSDNGSTGTRGVCRSLTGRFGRYKPQITPPYSQNVDNQSKTGIWWDIAPSDEYFKQLFRVSKNQIIWGANYFKDMPPTRCFLVWRKLSISEKFSMAMCEYAWTSFDANAKLFECVPQGTSKEKRFHPTQKPVALYKWILNNYAKEGDRILDTHLGSGSIAIACHDLGFELTGIELDGFYYEKAKERLKLHQRQLKLF